MKITFVFILLMVLNYAYPQVYYVKSKVLDNDNGKAIKYANIAVLNKMIGASSGDSGDFIVYSEKELLDTDSIRISAIGYFDTVLMIRDLEREIYLNSRQYDIAEVTVTPKKQDAFIVNPIELKVCNSKWSNFGGSFIIARYFPYNDAYSDFKYLDKIIIITEKHIKRFKFNVHIYKYDVVQKIPGEEIVNKNIIVYTEPKFGIGNNIVELDVSNYQLTYPESGLVIGLEWIVINENETEIEEDIVIGKKEIRIKEKKFGPSFALYSQRNSLTYGYMKGKWTHLNDFTHSLAISLILTD